MERDWVMGKATVTVTIPVLFTANYTVKAKVAQSVTDLATVLAMDK